MTQNFHRDYVKCVRNFCKSVPPVLQVTADELDTYFRSCAVYLWANLSSQPIDPFKGFNRLYTASRVKFTRQEFNEQINFYQSNPGETVGVPDFFLRMLKFDRDSNTDNSRRFIDVQSTVLKLCKEYIWDPSKLDVRRMEWMCEQLAIICDQAKIGPDGSRGALESTYSMEDAKKEIEETVAEVKALFDQLGISKE